MTFAIPSRAELHLAVPADYSPKRTALVEKAFVTGSWTLLSRTPLPRAIAMAATHAARNAFMACLRFGVRCRYITRNGAVGIPLEGLWFENRRLLACRTWLIAESTLRIMSAGMIGMCRPARRLFDAI